MTTEVIIRANAGWPVEVQLLPLTGDGPVQIAQIARVEPGYSQVFHVHSGVDLLIHEVQGPEVVGAIIACDEPILKHFAWAHLPTRLQAVSRPFGMLAARTVATMLRGPERSACLRKLLEAKDCAVRASLEG